MKQTILEKNSGTYIEVNGCQVPCLLSSLDEQQQHIGAWGQRHLRYLRQHRRATYINLKTTGKLNGYVTAEKKESKLQKALDAASKLIAKLKAEIDSLKQEISDYKSVHSKLRAAELERENTELRGKVRSYEDVIQRNNLWRFFHPRKEKAVTRDEAR